MSFIEIQNLFKRFKKVVAINHIQLEVKKGEMLTLLGPSGCGKTTTLRCIAGLEKPDEGDIVIDGKPMLHRDLSSRPKEESAWCSKIMPSGLT